ncbi:MAG: hypothetical protein Q7K55_01075 [Candidatus Levybacteria bacterium]|nr:hypothetical protein [Candidatus Levybacteria bacterium]
MLSQATGPPKNPLEFWETQFFPALPFALVIYPSIRLGVEPVLKLNDQKIWEKILKQKDPRAIAFLHKPTLDLLSAKPISNNAGVLVSIEVMDNKYFELVGISRVEIMEFTKDKNTNLLMTEVKLLEDKPKQSEINQSESIMVLGSLEAICSLLIQLSELLPEKDEIKKDIDFLINHIKDNRRSLNTAYYFLPCMVLRYFDFVEDELRELLLKNDDIIYRLQTIIDILKKEIKIFEMRQILFENLESFRDEDEGK